ERVRSLGDFTTTTRVLPIAGLAVLIGVVAAYVAAGLLRLIGLFTNLFFFQRVDTALVSPAGHHLGVFVVPLPVAGALVTGVMALLVAGAAAGMSATFAAPVASVLLAVELLLFEWKPRSAIPVALASVAAAAVRGHVLGMGPLFPVPAHSAFIGATGLAGCIV